ncbi:uncharacterized protein N7469_009824 [Penicillium citrinum]|uniref:DNA repair protein REV1 n=1 Tax=Penicillium citrinum TaxID=5077 RepID=A0A9W9TFH5_PENCI|nr:uncharacterized protein N7469_009824 [Penicillium citrinum]KAJ5220937.1 hypothetical protein N7469_009824 [Penicillium citrinum]
MGSRLEASSSAVRKRIENHDFRDEAGEEYEASSFGGFADYMRRKKIKLQNLDAEIRAQSGDCPPIFRGVVAHVNGYTQPSLQDLHRLIVSHGGGFLQYLDSKTIATHIIASSLTPKKREEFRRYRIVKPAWVTDSIKAGHLLPWDEYRLVDEGHAQKVLKFSDGRFGSQANTPRSSYKDQSRKSWYHEQLQAMESAGTLNTPSKPPRPSPKLPSQHSQSDYGDFPSFTALEGSNSSSPAKSIQDSSTTPKKPVTNSASDEVHRLPEMEQRKTESPRSAKKPCLPSGAQMTSEEYNAQLLSDPRMRNSSFANPDFLRQYYQESRLHHLSTWKAELKAQLQAATREKLQSQPPPKRPAAGSRRYILHVDFDSFFAAVSILKRPDLKEKPVAIAHGPGPGSEIASCNYVARGHGVKNGMWMKGALQACPELQVLPYDFPAYEDASRKFYSSVLAIDGVVQSVSIDEALIDITNQCLEAGSSIDRDMPEETLYREQALADGIARDLRDSIKEKTGCAVSVGIGGNILLAKVALRKAKPAGQFQLKPNDVLEFLGSLTIRDLPGFGYSLGAKMEELGVKLVKDVREIPRDRLISSLGQKTGLKMWEYARGIDKTEVGNEVLRKSVSAEVNWGIRFVNQEQAEDFLRSLCKELNGRLIENLVKGKQLTLKVMRSVVIGVATNASEILGKEAVSMLRSFNFSPGDLRGLGVQMTKLEPLKTGPTASLESSQRQLNFQKSPVRKKPAVDADPDELESPQKGDSAKIQVDPVLSNSAHKPLNMSGSQFIMPTQADPQVLSELPGDIRSRLVAQSKTRQNTRSGSPCPPPRPRERLTADLPPQSQLDPETLAALPEDVRREVLSYYDVQPTTSAPLAPPPAPAPSIPRPASAGGFKLRRPASPPKKRRGRPPKSASSTNNHLKQSSFAFPRAAGAAAASTSRETSRQPSPALEEQPEASAEFLAALPEDIRQEILEDQKRARMPPAVPTTIRPISQPQTVPAPATETPAPAQVEKVLHLPPIPARPVFTSQRLSALPDLRDAVRAWHDVFATDGPYGEDVQVLCTYLRCVITEEKDIDKAVSIVRWLMWLVGECASPDGLADAQQPPKSAQSDVVSWSEAVYLMQGSVQRALVERDLPPVEFE